MFTRDSLIRVCGAFVALALTAVRYRRPPHRPDYVTFSGPVTLTSVTLEAGSYTFDVADLMSTREVILVRSRGTGRACFFFTRRVDRPAGLGHDESVVLGETPKGVPPPVLGWYPIGENIGHEFTYKRTSP